MKRLLVFLFLVAACSDTQREPLGFLEQSLTQPVAAYAFEEGTGSAANEITGNTALRGTLFNGATWTTSGKHGKALLMPTSGASFVGVTTDVAALHLTTGMTLSAWVNPTVNNAVGAVITKLNTAGTSYNYELIASFGNNVPRVQYTKSGAAKTLAGTTALPLNTWSYIAATYDGTSLRMYQNGSLVATAAQPSPIDISTNWLEIGSDTGNAMYFHGAIDDVRVYDRALSVGEIVTDMNTGVGQSPPDASADAEASVDADAIAPDVPPYDASSAIFPLKLVSGKRYLADQTDKPFLIQGDAAWSLIANAVDADVETYLEDRRVKGFNAVVVNLIEKKYSVNAPNNFYNVPPFTTVGDLSTPNDAYFAFADTVVQKALSKNILLLLFPAYLGYPGNNDGWSAEMAAIGPTKLAAYGTYIANRYKNYPNIIWVDGGDDPNPNKVIVDQLATAIKAASPNQLHTAHAYDLSSARSFYGPSYTWLDVDALYQQEPSILAASVNEYNLSPIMPFFLLETWYENAHGITNATARREAYEPILGGAFGQLFGTQAVRLLDVGWQSNLDTQGTRDMQRLHTFFSGRHWELLVPDQTASFMTTGVGTGTSKASPARASDGSWAMIYLPDSRNFTVDLAGFSHSVAAKWFDPTSGAITPLQCSPFNNCGTLPVATTPGANSAGDQDWVLVIE